jgi:hypothetical protein
VNNAPPPPSLHRPPRPRLPVRAWLWDHRAGRRLDRGAHPLRALKERLAAWIERPPPPATLVVFVLPVLTAARQILGSGCSHRLLARRHRRARPGEGGELGVTPSFDLTRPKLLQIKWFRRVYDWVMRGTPGRTTTGSIRRRLNYGSACSRRGGRQHAQALRRSVTDGRAAA